MAGGFFPEADDEMIEEKAQAKQAPPTSETIAKGYEENKKSGLPKQGEAGHLERDRAGPLEWKSNIVVYFVSIPQKSLAAVLPHPLLQPSPPRRKNRKHLQRTRKQRWTEAGG